VKIVGTATSGRDIIPEIHLPLCQFSQGPYKRKAIVEPRDWLKSTVFTRWKTIWQWLQNPESRQLIAAEKEEIGARMLFWIENALLTHRKLRILYADKLKHVNDLWINNRRHRWSGTQCDLPREGQYAEPSICVIGVTGAAQSGHFDVIRIDDLVGKAAMESPLIMESTYRWFDNVEELLVEPDQTKPNASSVEIVGTHWGNGDFFCYVQDKYPEYQWRIVPALKDQDLLDSDNIKWINNPKVDHGESNWPQHRSTRFYRNMMANPEKETIFWAQHMNNPRGKTGINKIDPDWIMYYHIDQRDQGEYIVCEDSKKEEFSVKEIDWIGIIDPGGFAETKLLKRGSNNAILIGGQPKNSRKKFVRYIWAGKERDPEALLKLIFELNQKYRVRTWRIETVAAQNYIYNHILYEKKRRGIPMTISPLPKDTSRGAKDADIQALIPLFSNGEIYIMKNMRLLKAELVTYPSSLTLDLADCLAKLNKYFWTRTPKADLEKRYGESFNPVMPYRRDVNTGY